jgi:hypothetical protein
MLAELEQRHLDLIGLGLVAVGIYLGCAFYAGWGAGGPVGEWRTGALTTVAGRIAYVAPVALVGWGVALVMRPFLRAPGALNAGAILLLASLLLAFAAGTGGLGPAHPARQGYFVERFYSVHGGVVGEGLYWSATTLFQRLGAQILAVLMFVSGVLLMTGTTVSALLSRAGRAARTAGAGTRELAKTVRTGGLEGADARGDEIAITRAAPTEPLATEILGEGDTGELEAIGGDEQPGWEADGVERSGGEGEPPDRGQFAYEEALGPAEPDHADGSEAVDGEAAEEPARTPMGNKRSTTVCRRRPCSIGARATRAPTRAIASRSPRRCWRRSATSGSRPSCLES